MTKLIRTVGFIDVDSPTTREVTFTFEDEDGTAHVEFTYDEVDPSPDDLPVSLGESAWWISIGDSAAGATLYRAPEGHHMGAIEFRELDPETVAKVRARLDELVESGGPPVPKSELELRRGCCDDRRKPCAYHEGYLEGFELGMDAGKAAGAAHQRWVDSVPMSGKEPG